MGRKTAVKSKKDEQPKELTIHAYANYRRARGMAGVNRTDIYRRIEAGDIKLTKDRKVVVAQADAAWPDLANPKKHRAGQAPAFADVKIDHERIKSDLAKIELEKKRGELVYVRDVENQAFVLARDIRDLFMGMPSRLSPELAAESDTFKIETILTKEITQILERFIGMSKPIEAELKKSA